MVFIGLSFVKWLEKFNAIYIFNNILIKCIISILAVKPGWVGCLLFVHFLSLVLFVTSELGWSAFLRSGFRLSCSESCFDQMSDLLLSSSSLLKMRLFGRTCFSRGRLSESAPHPVSPSTWEEKNVGWVPLSATSRTVWFQQADLNTNSSRERPQWPKNWAELRSIMHLISFYSNSIFNRTVFQCCSIYIFQWSVFQYFFGFSFSVYQ